MVEAKDTPPEKGGRRVRLDKLAVAPETGDMVLAEPWRRLAAMLVDLLVIALLSRLAGAFLGMAIGVMLVVLPGAGKEAPKALQWVRWVLRLAGTLVVLMAVLAAGHAPLLRGGFNLALAGGESPAMRQSVFVPANASYGQLRDAADDLARQVDALKAEIHAERKAQRTLAGRMGALAAAAGVTVGWSGVYFTLLAGLLIGQTAGKFLLGIRAVRINGKPFTYFDGFVRQGGYVAGVAMGFIGFLKLLWDPNRQAVEDRVASTVVVRTR